MVPLNMVAHKQYLNSDSLFPTGEKVGEKIRLGAGQTRLSVSYDLCTRKM